MLEDGFHWPFPFSGAFQCFSMCGLHWKEFIITRLSKTTIVLTALNMWVSYKCSHIPQSQELATSRDQDWILQQHRGRVFCIFFHCWLLWEERLPLFSELEFLLKVEGGCMEAGAHSCLTLAEPKAATADLFCWCSSPETNNKLKICSVRLDVLCLLT